MLLKKYPALEATLHLLAFERKLLKPQLSLDTVTLPCSRYLEAVPMRGLAVIEAELAKLTSLQRYLHVSGGAEMASSLGISAATAGFVAVMGEILQEAAYNEDYPSSATALYRAKIDQPSTKSVMHAYHGKYVIIEESNKTSLCVQAWFTEGPTHSMIIPRHCFHRCKLSSAED